VEMTEREALQARIRELEEDYKLRFKSQLELAVMPAGTVISYDINRSYHSAPSTIIAKKTDYPTVAWLLVGSTRRYSDREMQRILNEPSVTDVRIAETWKGLGQEDEAPKRKVTSVAKIQANLLRKLARDLRATSAAAVNEGITSAAIKAGSYSHPNVVRIRMAVQYEDWAEDLDPDLEED
jgi:hypothetical protein